MTVQEFLQKIINNSGISSIISSFVIIGAFTYFFAIPRINKTETSCKADVQQLALKQTELENLIKDIREKNERDTGIILSKVNLLIDIMRSDAGGNK